MFKSTAQQLSEIYMPHANYGNELVGITEISPEKIVKGWGWEKVLINFPQYCAKILYFNSCAIGSYHFHVMKTETWYIYKGRITLRHSGPDGRMIDEEFGPGAVIHIPRYNVHQVIALEDTEIFEVSTPHFDEDTYRVSPGDSQSRNGQQMEFKFE